MYICRYQNTDLTCLALFSGLLTFFNNRSSIYNVDLFVFNVQSKLNIFVLN